MRKNCSLTGAGEVDYRTASMHRLACVVALLALHVGCADKGAPLEPPAGGGKADIADRVPVLGSLDFGGEVRGEIREDLEFHGYTLDVRAGALVKLDITHLGSSSALDSTLFVYGPATAAGAFGSDAIAFDDDSGWGGLSRLSGLALPEAGRYLIVVGTFDGQGRGRYRLTASCQSGECGPAPSGLCHQAIAADIRGCVADLLMDPERAPASELEAIELCGDIEPVADAFDAVCAASDPPDFCDGTLEEFALEVLPVCIFELQGEVLDRTCVFGSVYRDLFRDSGVHVVWRREIDSVTGLGDLERQQIVLAVQASSHTDVTTAEEALSRVDQNVINQVEVWDATGRRSFTAYEYGAGDNSYGRIFERGSTATAALIGDGDLRDCSAMFGPEERPCSSDDQCAEGIRCNGIAEQTGRGLCVNTAGDDDPAEGSPCSAAGGPACPLGSGLICAGLTREEEGLCLPAWMRRKVEAAPQIPIEPDAPTTSLIVMSGLATVDMDVAIELSLSHADSGSFRITLSNPATAEVVVFDGSSPGPVLDLAMPVHGFSGDEQVNGAWTLTVTDRTPGAGAANATLDRWSLLVGSRWD